MRLVAFTSTVADGAPGRRLGIERPDGILDLTDALGADLGAVLEGADPVAMLTDAEAEAAYEGQRTSASWRRSPTRGRSCASA
jgi:hypothetical protein